jgi:hypothetical protein
MQFDSPPAATAAAGLLAEFHPIRRSTVGIFTPLTEIGDPKLPASSLPATFRFTEFASSRIVSPISKP